MKSEFEKVVDEFEFAVRGDSGPSKDKGEDFKEYLKAKRRLLNFVLSNEGSMKYDMNFTGEEMGFTAGGKADTVEEIVSDFSLELNNAMALSGDTLSVIIKIRKG